MDSGKTEPLKVIEIAAGRDTPVRLVAELTRERDAAIAAVKAERDRNAMAMQQCEHLASEILAGRSRHARELEKALATIRNMERSWFWRMRMVSVRIRRLIQS